MATPKSFRYKSLMLVDDSPIDNLINQKMIEASSFAEHIYTFSGAVSALDFLKNLVRLNGISTDNIPELIFLDINMPILDGFQFLEEFENLNGPNAEVIKEIDADMKILGKAKIRQENLKMNIILENLLKHRR